MATQTITATEAEAQTPEPYQQYRWRQSSENTWEREIDEAERFYTSFCRTPDDPAKADFAITGSASFQVPVKNSAETNSLATKVEDALRSAWVRLRQECPALGSWIQYDSQTETWKRVYSKLDDSSKQDDWLAASFRIVETDLSDAEWFNSEPPVFKLPTLFVLKPTTADDSQDHYRGTVFFRSPHDTIDGHGILQLLDRLFELTASAYKGTTDDDTITLPNESSLLPPPMRVATAISPKPSDTQKQYFRETMAKNGAAALGLPPLGLPVSAASGTTSRKQRVYTTLSKSLTSELLAQCKEKGFTITHAISAAVVLALQQAQESTAEPKDLRYYMQALMSVRHMCQKPYLSLANAASNYHMIATGGMGVDVKVGEGQAVEDLEKEFCDISHQFKEYYVAARPSKAPGASRDDLDLAPLTWSLVTPQTAPGNAPAGDASGPGAVGISSLGNIASLVQADRGPISLTDVWVAGEGSGSSTPIMLGGYDGKIEISAIFDEAFHEKTYMKNFQRNVLKLAAQGLRLNAEEGLESHID